MEFKDFFETDSVFEYDQMAEILQDHDIEYLRVDDLRMFGEPTFVSNSGTAILRVRGDQLDKAIKVYNEWINSFEETEELEIYEIAEQSDLDIDYCKDLIIDLVGKKLEQVVYFIANDMKYEYGHIHNIDAAIKFVFESNQVMYWVFSEFIEENDPFTDILFLSGYKLTTEDVETDFLDGFEKIDLGENELWRPILNVPIKGIKTYTQQFGKLKLITDLILETDTNIVGIMSTNEPEVRDGEVEFDLSISNGWTTIVFDREIIEGSERLSDENL